MTTGGQITDAAMDDEPALGTVSVVMPSSAPGVAFVWWLLGIWLAVDLAACLAYVQWIAPLGFGALVYLLFGIPFLIAGFGVAVTWMWLGHDSRLARFADLPMGMAILSIVFVRSLNEDLTVFWPIFQLIAVGSMPLLLIRQRGFYITNLQVSGQATPAWWRFGIADMLLATTCLGVLLGLVSLGDRPLGELAWLVGLAAPTWLAAVLGFCGRSIYWGLVAVTFGLASFGVLIVLDETLDAVSLSEFLSLDLRVAIVVNALQLVLLTFAVTLLRCRGFRLRPVERVGSLPCGESQASLE